MLYQIDGTFCEIYDNGFVEYELKFWINPEDLTSIDHDVHALLHTLFVEALEDSYYDI